MLMAMRLDGGLKFRFALPSDEDKDVELDPERDKRLAADTDHGRLANELLICKSITANLRMCDLEVDSAAIM